MAVFLVPTLLIVHAISLNSYRIQHPRGVFGGPTIVSAAALQEPQDLALLSSQNEVTPNLSSYDTFQSDVLDEDGLITVQATLSDASSINPFATPSAESFSYKVQKGDTLQGLATRFGISKETIVLANPSLKRKKLTPGSDITLLPVSGILYVVKDGETAESIAAHFKVGLADMQGSNPGISLASLSTGNKLIVPGAIVTSGSTAVSEGADTKGYFIKPTDGYDWGILHPHNAVDIAASCGTPVWAAAEGVVVPDAVGPNDGDWNGGYGHFIMIEHPNGAKTRYAHLQTMSVSVGDYVQQKQIIGTMGETGESTGCHVHFEIYGARNPFAKS